MAGKQSAQLERKKFFADPIMVSMIVVLLVFLALFILYPLLMLLVDSFYAEGTITLDVFKRVLNLERFRNAFKNTLTLGFIVGFASTAIGLLFAYVEVYVKLKTKILEKLFGLVSMLPVVSPPFVLSLSMIMLFGRSGIITRSLLGIYDSNIYGLLGISVVQTLTFFPVCYLMLKGLLKNIDPSLEEATRDMGATRWKVFTSVTFPLLLPGLGNAFLVTFIEFCSRLCKPNADRWFLRYSGNYHLSAGNRCLRLHRCSSHVCGPAFTDCYSVPDPEILPGEENSRYSYW